MTAVAVTLLVLPAVATTAAFAMSRATSSGTVTASTATWGAVATTASAAPYSSSALVLTYAKNGTKAPAAQYFWLVNTGTLALSSVTGTVTSSVAGKAETCSGTWNETTGVCVGTVGTLDTTTAGGTVAAVSLAPGARTRVKASLTAALPPATATMTVSLAVPRTAARPKATTSS